MKLKILILLINITLSSIFLCAERKGYKLNVDKPDPSEQQEERMARGSFMVTYGCHDCNNGYQINQIVFSGYDKPKKSALETFFITNHTDRTMTGITLYINYLTPDGRQLNKRYIQLDCNIPAGETRAADIKSWDLQKQFYYEKSDRNKSGGSPYTVIFEPISFYLRY